MNEMQRLADKIAAFPVSADWTAQLNPPEERSQYDFVVVKLSEADRDAVVAALRAQAQGEPVAWRSLIHGAAKEGNLTFWRASAAQEKAYSEWKSGGFLGDCPQMMTGTLVDYITDAILAALSAPVAGADARDFSKVEIDRNFYFTWPKHP
ncbi:MAG: hypothetical protein JWQ03_3130 [Variovorax sp.]|nr:hypothetical protein [Variovorax sp.]